MDIRLTLTDDQAANLTAEDALDLLQRAIQRSLQHASRVPVVRRRIADWRDVVLVAEGGCLLWQGAIDKGGYGVWGSSSRPGGNAAHRRVYELEVGPIPAGHHVDHLCGVRACVNPEHLEAVPPAENNRRSTSPSAVNARKTHCKRGHEFTDENTYVRTTGRRACRTCQRWHNRELYRRKATATQT